MKRTTCPKGHLLATGATGRRFCPVCVRRSAIRANRARKLRDPEGFARSFAGRKRSGFASKHESNGMEPCSPDCPGCQEERDLIERRTRTHAHLLEIQPFSKPRGSQSLGGDWTP